MLANPFDFTPQCRDAMPDFAAVHFEFRFSGTTRSDAASQPGQVVAVTGQSRQSIIQLRMFHLQLSLFRSGTAGKDVENEARAVHNFGIESFFEVSRLIWRKFVVKYNDVCAFDENCLLHLIDFAFSDIRGGIGTMTMLDDLLDDSRAG